MRTLKVKVMKIREICGGYDFCVNRLSGYYDRVGMGQIRVTLTLLGLSSNRGQVMVIRPHRQLRSASGRQSATPRGRPHFSNDLNGQRPIALMIGDHKGDSWQGPAAVGGGSDIQGTTEPIGNGQKRW